MHALIERGQEVSDLGAYSVDAVDYPDIASLLGRQVVTGEYDYGILICGTGVGMSIAVNKIKGIRAALCCHALFAQLARRHNNANILCLAAMNDLHENLACVDIFLKTDFEGGRHINRINKITALDHQGCINNVSDS